MPDHFEGSLVAPDGSRFAIVASRFNEAIVRRLLEGAQETLARHGADPELVDVAWAPGAFEIPIVASRLAGSGRYDAVICLGAVIRGATAHFDYVAGPVASGCSRVALDTGVPVLFGVLTVDTLEQAWERAGTKAGNKGSEAASGAVEMVSLMRQIEAADGPAA
jgi:6,7-dimethyl-8-ribityllumazine synthase